MAPALVWSRQALGSLTFAGITVIENTPTGVNISWAPSEPAQGQVVYGTTPGGPYPFSSTLETGYLTFHLQTIANLAPGSNFYARIWGLTADGRSGYSDEFEFDTVADSAFDEDCDYTDVAWPTGTGWTAGAESTILANIQALITSSGNGNGDVGGGITHYVRHLPAAGALYPINNGIDLSLRQYLTFEGGGVDLDEGDDVTVGGVTRRRITATGHTGGATIRTSGSPTASPSGRGSAFYTVRAANLPAATGIRMHGLTIEGTSTNYETTSAGNGGERQHGIHMAGWDTVWIDHCLFDKNKGDGIYMTDSYGGSQSGYRTRNVRVTHTYLRRNGRMLIANVHALGPTVEDCLFSGACYAHLDVEPNFSWSTCGDLRVLRSTFLDWGWDPDFYGSPLLMTAAQDGVEFTGYIDWIDNVMVGLSKTTGRPAEWNSDVTMAPYSVFTKTGLLTMTGNISLRQKPGPAIYLSRNTGGAVIANNKGFLSSGSFVGGSSGGGVVTVGAGSEVNT